MAAAELEANEHVRRLAIYMNHVVVKPWNKVRPGEHSGRVRLDIVDGNVVVSLASSSDSKEGDE